jgi:hypothetical protein
VFLDFRRGNTNHEKWGIFGGYFTMKRANFEALDLNFEKWEVGDHWIYSQQNIIFFRNRGWLPILLQLDKVDHDCFSGYNNFRQTRQHSLNFVFR